MAFLHVSDSLTMSSMRKTRELAMQTLFLWDTQGQCDEQSVRQVMADGTEDEAIRRRAVEMAQGAWDAREATDAWLERLAPQWPPRRQPGVDRGILRLAVWELCHADTPPKVVIDEAIELAKAFSTEQSPAFVNGVLDAVLRERRAAAQPSVPEPAAEPGEPSS